MARPVVITGGGTGGHVFPMQAIAEALHSAGLSDVDLRFVGSRRGQEAQLLSDSNVALTLLPGRGLRRSLKPKDVVVNVGAALGLLAALVMALGLIRRWRPSVVVSVGGYASFAISLAAACWRVPLVLVELDSTPGAAQRLVARRAAKRCCAFPTEGANVVVTGAPLRLAIERIDRSPEARALAKGNATPPIGAQRTTIVVMTGSLGSTKVNNAVSELAKQWASRRDCTIVHVTGRRDFNETSQRAPQLEGFDYRVVEFGDMVSLWALADVAVCRAGATTLAELSALSIPSVLVPLPNAPDDHQTKNARAVVEAGGATLIADVNCNALTLGTALEKMMDPSTLRAMASGAGTLGHRDAAGAIASVVLGVRGGS
jgi:UDP-N-acetylglucosamine:LPS N-acetylglucosamine transferase